MSALPLRFGEPWWLLALLALPALVLLARRSRSGLERVPSALSTALRVILLGSLVFALADATWRSKSWRTATIFVLDHSFSIPQDVQSRSVEWINERLKEVPRDDVAAVVLFGGDAMIEVPPTEQPVAMGLNSLVVREATDIGAAMRLALALFPTGYQRRIVLLSDGNENRGHALAEAELARAHGAVVDVLPLHYDYPNEVWVEGLHVPGELLPKEPFDVTAVVNAQRAGPARLSIYRNGQLLAMTPVEVSRGKNVFTVKQKVEAPGSYAYRAVVEMAGDTVSQNNEAHAFAQARGEARLAIVAGEPVDGERLAEALRGEGLEAVLLTPGAFALAAGDAATFDAIVFANVEAAQLPKAAVRAVEAAVHDAGVGFIMIGGERSFGPGGWRGSPVEELLPVTMEQPQRRVLPNGALCLILHTCELPNGNHWAKEIGLAALHVLNARDYMGVLMYGAGDQWLFPMQLVDKDAMADKIRNAMPGDMPSFDGTMKMAHEGLKPLEAASKHLVVISDADPSGPHRDLVNAIVADNISITTIAMFPHGSSDVDKMAAIARAGRGRFYQPTDPSTLPQIFIKEAATLQRSMIIEGRVAPVLLGSTDALRGFRGADLPAIHGYTLTSPKPRSRVSLGVPIAKEGQGDTSQFDALMVEWIHGLGRTMAFTSDAKARWGKEWVAWPQYAKFWSQAVRSVLRTVPRAPWSVQTEIEGGRGRVVVDAIDERGKFDPTLQFAGSVTSPLGAKLDLRFRQTGPGRYEAEFEASEVGVYGVTGSFEDARGQKGFIAQGVPLSYAPEYRDLRANMTLLHQIQERTGGRRLAVTTPVYAPLATAVGHARPLWPWLLAALLATFPIDVFLRRVSIDGDAVRRLFRRRRKAAVPAPAPSTIAALAAKKEEVRARLSPPKEDVDLGLPVVPKPSAPPPAVPAPAPPPAAAKPASDDDFMKRLLEAKKKARKE